MANQESAPLWKRSRSDAALVLVDRGRYLILPRGCGVAALALLLAVGVVVVALALTRETWLAALGRFLVYQENPRPADAIVILGGGAESRPAFGAALYRAGYAPLVIVSSCDDIYGACSFPTPYDQLRNAGVPDAAIRVLPAPVSTRSEALLSLDVLREAEARSVLLVTDDFHSRRAYTIFTSVYAGSGIAVISTPVRRDWFNPERWWDDPRAQVAVGNEYVKLVWFLLGFDA